MAFIRYPAMPDSIGVGRQAKGVTFRADTLAEWVAEVDEVQPGEQELTMQAYLAACEANAAHNAALPAPAAPGPSPRQVLRQELQAATTLAEAKAALLKYHGG